MNRCGRRGTPLCRQSTPGARFRKTKATSCRRPAGKCAVLLAATVMVWRGGGTCRATRLGVQRHCVPCGNRRPRECAQEGRAAHVAQQEDDWAARAVGVPVSCVPGRHAAGGETCASIAAVPLRPTGSCTASQLLVGAVHSGVGSGRVVLAGRPLAPVWLAAMLAADKDRLIFDIRQTAHM